MHMWTLHRYHPHHHGVGKDLAVPTPCIPFHGYTPTIVWKVFGFNTRTSQDIRMSFLGRTAVLPLVLDLACYAQHRS